MVGAVDMTSNLKSSPLASAHGLGALRPHTAVRLVQRRGAAPARAGADLRALLAVRRPRRPGRRAGLVPRDRRRRRADPRHARPGGRAARVRQRLPPPRRGADGRLRHAQDDPVPLPRLDLRPRRLAASAPRSDREPDFDNGDWSLLPASVDTWGPFLFVNPTPTRRRSPSTSATCPTILARDDRHRRARVPLARRVRRERELEDRRRELPRVLPLPDRAPGVQRRGRRPSRPLPARGPPDVRGAVRARRSRPASAASSTCSSRTPASTSSPGPANLSIGPIAPDRAGPDRALPRLLLRARRSTPAGSRSSSRSTTRSAARTRCSSSRCTAAWPPGWSSRDGCC